MNKFEAAEKFGLTVDEIMLIDRLILSNRMNRPEVMRNAEAYLANSIMETYGLSGSESIELARDRIASTGNSFMIVKIILLIGVVAFLWKLFF